MFSQGKCEPGPTWQTQFYFSGESQHIVSRGKGRETETNGGREQQKTHSGQGPDAASGDLEGSPGSAFLKLDRSVFPSVL